MSNLAINQQPEQAFQYLKLVSFKDLENWSAYFLLGSQIAFNNEFERIPIQRFLRRNKKPINVNNDKLYKRATIKINNGGAFLRDELLGNDIGTKKQFLICEGQFLLSKIDARNGAFGVVPPELDKGIITGNFWTFDVDYSVINPFYLGLLTGTLYFQKLCQTASVGTTNRNYLQEDLFLDFKIPLPRLSEQETILARYNKKITEAERLEQELTAFNDRYQNTIFEHLGIEVIQTKQVKNKLQFVNFKDVSRWGYHFLSNHEQNGNLLFTKKFPAQNFIKLVAPNPNTDFNQLQNDDEISFLPMECISDIYGEVVDYKKGVVSKSKGYTKFQERDLLWSKITPCMQNGKSCVVTDLNNGFGYGSTEYHVLRNKDDDILDIRFLYHLLRTKYVLNNAVFHFTGSAGQQRVPIDFLNNLEIPLPPLPIQKQIVQELDTLVAERKTKQSKAEKLRKEAQQEFEQTVFLPPEKI